MKWWGITLIILGVFSVLVVPLILFNAGLLSIFSYNKQISFDGFDATAISTKEFGITSDSWRSSSCNDEWMSWRLTNTVPSDQFSIYLSSTAKIEGTSCGPPPFKPVQTKMQTINLGFSTETLKSFEITFNQQGSLACPDPNADGVGQPFQINLIGPTTIPLFTSEVTVNVVVPSTSKFGKIKIFRSGNDFIIDFLGERNLINIPEGNYELELTAGIPASCGGGGIASEKIEITDIKIEELSDLCEGIICEDKCENSVSFYEGYCDAGECIYNAKVCEFGCLGDFCAEDPCIGIDCGDKCENSMRFFNGYCSGGECVYDEEVCDFGCVGDFCAENHCIGVDCDDKCEDSIWYHSGFCELGRCIYIKETCEFGCENVPLLSVLGDGGMCRDDPCIGVDCEDYCIGDDKNTFATGGKCVNGKCQYPQAGEKQYAKECGFVSWYKNIWVYVGAGTFIIIISFGIWYWRRK